ncbi:MAG: HEAT repeat domain-containing protein [Haliscomenobacter sp.]|nr:HEAT repeat domain-containing protein [Haliscomenobacter sp.]
MAKSLTSKDLLVWLQSPDPEKVIAAAEELRIRKSDSGIELLLSLLKITDNNNVRNAVALTLADLKEERAFQILHQLLLNDSTAKSRGTLLYAISVFDCTSIFPLLIDFVIEGNFEVSRQAFSILEQMELEIDEKTFHEYSEKLQKAIENASQDRLSLLLELQSFFIP